MHEITKQIEEQFNSNVDSVRALLRFDELILEVSLTELEGLNEKLKNVHGIDNPYLLVNNSIKALVGVKEHKSLKSQYERMYNQCLVLLVSYFTSAINDLFIKAIQYSIVYKLELNNSKEDLKFSLKELENYNFDLREVIGEIIVSKNQISFQDMQSTCRSFKDYLSIEIKQDEDINNIIFSQACRHSIVHALSEANEKCINQIKNAIPRDLKDDLKTGDKISFSIDEIETVIKSMYNFIRLLTERINELGK